MKTFETKAFLMTIHDDFFIEFKVKKNITLQESDIWESRELSINYLPNTKFKVLMETDENFNLSLDARRAGASKEYAQHVSALALCSNRMHEMIIGHLFLKINKPHVPTKFFNDRTKAIEWLNKVST